MSSILVTGGAGYIGSHTVLALLEQGASVVVLDNLSNSNAIVIDRLEHLTGNRPELVVGDIRHKPDIDRVFAEKNIASVIHFAGLKAVGESVEQPLLYYQNNVEGSLNLFESMQEAGCNKLVFSSSATVYGDPHTVPIVEDFPLTATNPYGRSKLMIEDICRDMSRANSDWQIALLRYFNPIAAHASGTIGEDPKGIPNNLMPYIAQVAVGRLAMLSVYGDDYSTPDGTGVRDYIHVVDLANAHLKALDKLTEGFGCQAFNIGTGQGYSVLEMIKAFEKASDRHIPYQIVERRAGDIAACYADPALSASALGWQAEHGLQEMMRDHWAWQSANPDGYRQ